MGRVGMPCQACHRLFAAYSQPFFAHFQQLNPANFSLLSSAAEAAAPAEEPAKPAARARRGRKRQQEEPVPAAEAPAGWLLLVGEKVEMRFAVVDGCANCRWCTLCAPASLGS